MDLTRARSEVLRLKDELALTKSKLESAAAAAAFPVAGADGDGNPRASPTWQLMEQLKASMGVAEGSLEASLVARLAAAQVMKREAEEQVEQLRGKLAAAEEELAELQVRAEDSWAVKVRVQSFRIKVEYD